MTANPLLDQARAAIAESRVMVAGALGLDPNRARPRTGTSAIFEELWQVHVGAPRCRHLQTRPAQPSLMSLPDATWRCRSCASHWAADRRRRGLTYDPIEEHTCDRCRRYTPSGLTPTIVRQDLWMVILSTCRRCAQTVQDAGGELVQATGDQGTPVGPAAA